MAEMELTSYTVVTVGDGNPTSASHTHPPDTLAVAANSIARCWQKGAEIYNSRLSADDERRIDDRSPNSYPVCKFGELLDDVINAKQKCDDSRSGFQEKLEGLINAIQPYAPVIDVLIQQQPNITSIVWDGLRFLLGIAAAKNGVDLQVEDGIIWVLINLPRWYQNVTNDLHGASTLDSTSQLFSCYIQFVMDSRSYYESSNMAKHLRTSFGTLKGQIDRTMSCMKDYSEAQQFAASSAEVEKSIHHRNVQGRYFELQLAETNEQTSFREDSRNLQQRADRSMSDLLEIAEQLRDEQYQRKVRRAIKLLKPTQHIPSFREESTAGTCKWIFGHRSFQRWVDTNYDRPLWIRGILGCGKSVLADFLHKNIGPLPTTLAYFFSAFANNESADAKSLARSLVLQLLQKGISSPNSECQPAIDELASFCLEFENGSQIPFYSLRSVIATAFKKMPRCSLIIDGLDECMDIANVRHLVEDFIDLDIEHRPKAIILSRQTEDLSEFMANSVAIVMDTKTIMSDIEQFISKKIAEYPDLDSIQEQIYAKIRQSQSSGGMFLWASQMMDCLMQPARTEEKQLRRLERIPEGLTNAFEQRVSQHGKGRKPSDLMLRREILLLLLASKRALMIGELEVALQFKTRYRQQKARRLNDVKGEVQDLCKPLVSVMEDRVAFIHSSVGDFLCTPEPAGVNLALSIHMTLKQSHSELASRCLNVLSEEQNRSPERIAYWLYKNVYADVPRHLHDLEAQANLNREIIFYEYAARYWDYHLTAVKDPTAALLNQLNEFLRNYEFVTWAEYLYNLKSEIAPVAEVLGDLKSWKVSLPVNKRDAVDLDAFFTRPYRRLSEYYAQNGEDHLLKYLCLYHLGDFYALQYDLDAEYDVKRDVASGFESILGNRNPLTLRAKYSFGMCYTVRGELTQALDLYLNISAIQKVVCGLHNPDYYQSLQQVAFLQFLMTRFEEANITQVEVSLGLSNIRGSKRRLVLESNIFDGYIHEALGLLETALALYQYVYKTQSGILGQNNPLALYAQICMASAYRKQHKYAEALENLEYAFQIRQQLWGLADPSVVDTAIQLIILYREMKRFDDANARIDLIMDEGQLENKFQRYCQVKHIQALVLIDQGEFETPRKILQSLLDRQGEKGREFNNRSLLWVRLTLATILKQHGKDDEVGMLFYGLVTPLQDGDISPQFERIESLGEMKIAELALRLIRERQRNEAESLLEENNLRWSRKEDFWLFEGGPSADTAWMEGP